MILTATPEPDFYRIRFDVSAAPGPTVVISRSNVDGTSSIVRGADGLIPIDGVVVAYDREAPLGMDVLYTASSGTESATVITMLNVETPVLSHPSYTSLTQPIYIIEDRAEWKSASVVHEIHLSSTPIVSVQRMRMRSGTLTLTLADRPAADLLIAAWSEGWPLYLRVPCDSIRGGWLLATRLSETQFARVSRRTFQVDYTVVAEPPVTTYITERWTFEDLATEEATFADVLSSYESFANLRDKI